MQPDVIDVQLTLYCPVLARPRNAAARRAETAKDGRVHAVGLGMKWVK